MAKQLDAFPDSDAKRGRYPWGQWLNGQPWELSRGTKEQVDSGEADFFVEPRSFRSAVQQAAKARAKREPGTVRTVILNKGTGIAVQYLPETAEETDENN